MCKTTQTGNHRISKLLQGEPDQMPMIGMLWKLAKPAPGWPHSRRPQWSSRPSGAWLDWTRWVWFSWMHCLPEAPIAIRFYSLRLGSWYHSQRNYVGTIPAKILVSLNSRARVLKSQGTTCSMEACPEPHCEHRGWEMSTARPFIYSHIPSRSGHSHHSIRALAARLAQCVSEVLELR